MLVPSHPRVDPNPWSGGVVWLVIEFPRHTLACQMNAYDDHIIKSEAHGGRKYVWGIIKDR